VEDDDIDQLVRMIPNVKSLIFMLGCKYVTNAALGSFLKLEKLSLLNLQYEFYWYNSHLSGGVSMCLNGVCSRYKDKCPIVISLQIVKRMIMKVLRSIILKERNGFNRFCTVDVTSLDIPSLV
jgi:hypothetical protein